MSEVARNLQQAVAHNPFPDFKRWWPMGHTFLRFMSKAIVSEWSQLEGNGQELATVQAYTSQYLKTVFDAEASANLVEDFVNKNFSQPFQSGEFDALSYAFYRSAFELIASQTQGDAEARNKARRQFTKRVGKQFFQQLRDHLQLKIPNSVNDRANFQQLKVCIQEVGNFFKEEGYLRDHFAFYFDVDVEHSGKQIKQTDASFLEDLRANGVAYALYEMSYPVILPSAVYLYKTIGEAQHHSSRIIEGLFEMAGCDARETDDFDPSEYSSEDVVELWEIRKFSP